MLLFFVREFVDRSWSKACETGEVCADRSINILEGSPTVCDLIQALIPGLRNRSQPTVDVVIKLDTASKRINHRIDSAEPGIIDRDVVAIAIFNLRAVEFTALPLISHLRAVGCAQDHRAGIQQQMR